MFDAGTFEQSSRVTVAIHSKRAELFLQLKGDEQSYLQTHDSPGSLPNLHMQLLDRQVSRSLVR